MRHVTRMNESYHSYEWVMSHIWMSHHTNVIVLCCTYEWAMAYICTGALYVLSPHDNIRPGTHLNKSYIQMIYVTLIRMRLQHTTTLVLVLRHATRLYANESYHIREYVTSHKFVSLGTQLRMEALACLNESCHKYLYVRHTYEWVMSHTWMNPDTHMSESCHTCECVTSHVWMSWMSHVTSIKEPWHIIASFISHIWMSHVTHMNESCHAYEWVMSRIWMSHVTHMNESCHTYEWVMSHMWIRHVTQMCESEHTIAHVGPRMSEWVMSQIWICPSQIWMSHVTHMNECWHTYECVMSHMNASRHTYEWVMSHVTKSHVNASCCYEGCASHIRMSHVTSMNESCHK